MSRRTTIVYDVVNNTAVLVTDEFELRPIAAGSGDDVGRLRDEVDHHGGTWAGGEQLQSGQDAYPVRGRAVRGVQDDGRDSVGRGKTPFGFHSGHILVGR